MNCSIPLYYRPTASPRPASWEERKWRLPYIVDHELGELERELERLQRLKKKRDMQREIDRLKREMGCPIYSKHGTTGI